MKPQTEKTMVGVYRKHGYNYVVVLTEDTYCNQPMYACDFFKTRERAQRFNREQLHNFGEVMTALQATKKYDFFVE